MDTDDKFEVTDKRRVSAVNAEDSSTEPEISEPGEGDGSALPPMDVYGLLKTTISLFSSSAWAWMGLSPSPFTGQMERNLEHARVAIDTVSVLTEKADAGLTDEERREIQNTLSMLRVNFVQQSGK